VYLARHELQVPLPDVVALQTRQPSLEGTGEITLRALVKEALRMRPSRVMGYLRIRVKMHESNALSL